VIGGKQILESLQIVSTVDSNSAFSSICHYKGKDYLWASGCVVSGHCHLVFHILGGWLHQLQTEVLLPFKKHSLAASVRTEKQVVTH